LKSGWIPGCVAEVEEWVSFGGTFVWEGKFMRELKSERGASFLCCDFFGGAICVVCR